jgi:PAS domain-containing protein
MLLSIGLSLFPWYGGMWRGRLQRSGTQLKDVMAALEHVSEPVIIMAGHTIKYVNAAALKTFGYQVCGWAVRPTSGWHVWERKRRIRHAPVRSWSRPLFVVVPSHHLV